MWLVTCTTVFPFAVPVLSSDLCVLVFSENLTFLKQAEDQQSTLEPHLLGIGFSFLDLLHPFLIFFLKYLAVWPLAIMFFSSTAYLR